MSSAPDNVSATEVGQLLYDAMGLGGIVRIDTPASMYTLAFGTDTIRVAGYHGAPIGDFPFSMAGLAAAMKRIKEIGV